MNLATLNGFQLNSFMTRLYLSNAVKLNDFESSFVEDNLHTRFFSEKQLGVVHRLIEKYAKVIKWYPPDPTLPF